MTKSKTGKSLFIYADGASRGNPGPAAAGVAIYDADDNLVREFGKYLGIATNNIAEYMALIYGLHEALILKAREVIIFSDSELVVKQLSGNYRVRDNRLKLYFDLAGHLLKDFKFYKINHIDRSQNKQADEIANKAINLASLI
jgi:ribonuclease HI